MEPKPLGLPQIEFIARREQLEKELSPQAWALYQFIENAWRLERQNPKQTKHEFTFDFGRTAEIILIDVFDGFEDALPVLPNNPAAFEPFTWRIENPKTQKYELIDMEIYFKPDEIEFRSKNNNLSMILAQWYQLVDGIDYPITAIDQSSVYRQSLETTALRGLGPNDV